jgi:hypothetical protein
MKPNPLYLKSLATTESLVHLITCLTASVRNPERQSQARDVVTEQKVVASIRKHAAKHQTVES